LIEHYRSKKRRGMIAPALGFNDKLDRMAEIVSIQTMLHTPASVFLSLVASSLELSGWITLGWARCRIDECFGM